MDKKSFKTSKNRALGSSREHNFTPGDMVWWKTWEISLENEIFETNRLENTVLIAKIMPFGASEYEFIPLISVKKSIKQD